jgi:hypothetical protein
MLITGHVFEDQKVLVAFDGELDHADDLWVFELDLDVGLTNEEIAEQKRLALARSVSGQRFDCYLLFIFGEKCAFGEVDLTHSSFTDLGRQAITTNNLAN